MTLKAPKFWFRKKDEVNIPALLLYPLSKFWEYNVRRRAQLGTWEKMPVPVICIGNIVIGGSGKTPVTQAIQCLLKEMGLQPHVVSRGYGGKSKGPIYVSATSTYSEVGDEPILLSKTGPVLVAKDKKRGIYKACKNGANIILLDDGFQNTSVAKDLSLVVVDSKILFGNQRVIPSGPLREPIQSGFSRAGAIILVNHDKNNISKPINFEFPSNIPIIKATIKPKIKLTAWTGKRVVAFSGIAHPEKFHVTLKNLGCEIVGTYNFSDHYPYKKYDIAKLKVNAQSLNAKLVTTEKDFIRIPLSQQADISKLPVQIKFENHAVLKKLLNKILL